MASANSVYSILPEQASTFAPKVDALYMFLNLVSVFFTILTVALVVVFIVKYRRRSQADNPTPPHADSRLEILCSAVLLVLVLVMFGWGTLVYVEGNAPPAGAREIFVTGKQWMWKIQHPEGKREINELHVPLGQTVKLTMTSEDVIHDFFIPAFRTKNDVLPGRYTSIWFTPTKIGQYRLFCAEYCGTDHSRMGGWVHVMPQADYERWVRGANASQESPVVTGGRLFNQLGCATCHSAGSAQLGPNLAGVFGHEVKLADGSTLIADEEYLRESIINSQAKIVAGFAPVMPLFKGLVTEEQLAQIIAYIKSLSPPPGTGSGT